ncbi:MAG TPA: M56 family metallopeptidase [Rhizomicrobium sp.]|jgi:beta-lactamase regulating signal transducer with metallopeptidase domain
MTSLVALRALLFAGELLAGSIFVMALAWIFAAQKRASARHLAWAGAFGAALILPLFLATIPSPLHILLPAAPETIPVQVLSEAASATTLPAPADSGITLDPATIAFGLAALWLLGIVILSIRFAASAFCLALLRRGSKPFALAPEDMPRVAATRRECELRISESENGPITWGVFRPVVLLPRTAVTWPRERLHAVLLHELAHIRRRDGLTQVLSLFVCMLYWPNPFVWLGARALRREAEIAADDSVLLAGVKPSSYAGELLALAAEFRMRAPAVSALSLFMAAPSALEARVESVLEPTSLRMGVTNMDVIRIAGLGIVAAGAIAFACPSLAQDSRPAPVETAPLAPVAPAVPTAPESAPLPEVPAVPAVPAIPASPATPVIYEWQDGHLHRHHLTAADRARIHAEVARAQREARKAIERVRPQIEKAMADAKIGEETARAVREAQPEIDAAVAKATREAQEAVERAKPDVQRALADAKIGEQAAEAVRAAAPEIDRAMDEAMANVDSRKVRIEVNRALAEAQREVARAHIDERVSERVNAALERAQRKVDADTERAEAREEHASMREKDKDAGEDKRQSVDEDDGNDDSSSDDGK